MSVTQVDPAGGAWLQRLRWGAVAGQLATIAIARFGLGLELPLPALLAVVAAQALYNVLDARAGGGRGATPGRIARGLAFDIVALSALLALSGGPHNPFSFVYLVHVSLAAMVLPQRLTWTLCALAATASGLLFVLPVYPLAPEHDHDGHFMALHLNGMWVAFAVAAGFIVYFMVRIRAALQAREEELARVRQEAQRNERLSGLATLAAGAAHELATPLGTIATVARELERRLAASTRDTRDAPVSAADAELLEDARLIRAQVERCRGILQQMTIGFGASRVDELARRPVADWVASALGELPADRRARVAVEVAPDAASARCVGPRAPLEQALRNLVGNALDATHGRGGEAEKVRVGAVLREGGHRVEIQVRDRGPGIPPETLARVGEPFFTTKPAGQGMGLGVFVARGVARELGGELTLESTPGAGTTARLVLPCERP